MRVCYHSAVGTINRPFNTKPDTEMHPKDLAAYKVLGKLGKELTGYPMVSVYDDFGTRKHPSRGTSLEWHYEHMGLFSFVFESWDIEKKAGCGDYERRIPYQREKGERAIRTEEEWLKILRWADNVVGEEAFKVWVPFDHPQLGQVEIGGWRRKFVFANPPPKILENEIENDMTFGIEIARFLPLVKVMNISVSGVHGGLHQVEALIENTGFFPTNITEQAKILGRAGSVRANLEILSGAELVGLAKRDLGHLEGKWRHESVETKASQKTARWILKVTDPESLRIKVRVKSEKAGVHEREFRFQQ